MTDNYYIRPEVSNSDLSWLQKYWLPDERVIDLETAYRFGTLIDCMITEPHKVNYYKLTCADYAYSKPEFECATEMKRAFQRDSFCHQLMKNACCQKVSVVDEFKIELDGFHFYLSARCKWDLFVEGFDMSADIKSTIATTQKQFEECIRYFDYDRQRAWYMDIEGRSNDILIGISKVNFKIFKVPVKRGSELFKSGQQKYKELAFKWWYLFGEIKDVA